MKYRTITINTIIKIKVGTCILSINCVQNNQTTCNIIRRYHQNWRAKKAANDMNYIRELTLRPTTNGNKN